MKSKKPVVIITGVSSGIGLATARVFAEHDWIVVGTTRSGNRPAELGTLPIDFQSAEMARPSDLERVVASTHKTYGRIDGLVCNAGYGLIGVIDTLDYAQMHEQLVVNTLAPAELIRRVVPIMKKQKSGVIIGISSGLGVAGRASYSLYSASKFGLSGLFESLWHELAPAGVHMRLIEPSETATAFWDAARHSRFAGPRAAGIAKRQAAQPQAMAGRRLTAQQVADEVYRAAADTSGQLHYPLGQTKLELVAKRFLPDPTFRRLIMRRYK